MFRDLAERRGMGGIDQVRALALLNVAIHDAVVTAWTWKRAYPRPRPTEDDGGLVPEMPVPRSPSYPCEYAAAAGAASEILAHLFPADAAALRATAHEAAWSRAAAAVAYPSDVRAGLDLGAAVAARAIEYADTRDDRRAEPRSVARDSGAPDRPVAGPRRGDWLENDMER